jgi:hypothetical protein
MSKALIDAVRAFVAAEAEAFKQRDPRIREVAFTELEQALREYGEDQASERRNKIVELANEAHGCEGDLQIEFDDDAIVSEGEDNGAYVQAWVWLDFSGTEFDKDQLCSEPGCGNKLDDGEGFDGRCGTCADKHERKDENATS